MNRMLLRSLVALALLATSALIGYRVLGPAELVSAAMKPYPMAVVNAPGLTGRTSQAPLIVDGRLRVYAGKHQIRADGPVDLETIYTALWSYRRWPQQLSGVVASGSTVITRWSDGKLVALDGRTGKVAWRADGPDAPGYAGHRTGAAAVWTPPGLRLAAGAVVVTQGADLAGYDLSTGARRWQARAAADCTDSFTTSGGILVCPSGAYDAATGASAASWPAGPFTALGCDVARSACAAFRDGSKQGWLASDGTPRRTTQLDASESSVAAGAIVSVTDGGVTGQTEGGPQWRWSGTAQLLGGTSDKVVLLTPERRLIGLNARTGAEAFNFRMADSDKEKTDWKPGMHQITEHYLALERLHLDAADDPDAPTYYLSLDAVLIAGY